MKNKFWKASLFLVFLSCDTKNDLNKNSMIRSSDNHNDEKKEYEEYVNFAKECIGGYINNLSQNDIINKYIKNGYKTKILEKIQAIILSGFRISGYEGVKNATEERTEQLLKNFKTIFFKEEDFLNMKLNQI